MTWAPLWCKSNFSFLEGASHPEELVDRAGALGLTSLALTDRRGVYGLVRAYGRARDTGLNLIAGAEVDLVTGTRLVLLARSREGYASLCALTTRGHHGQAKGSFVLTAAQVAAGAQDLEVLWTLPDLPAPGAPDPGAPGSPEADLAILADALGDRLTAAVDRHLWVTDPGREARLTAGARRFGLSLAAVPRVLYHDPSRQELQDVLTCLRHRVRRADAGTRVLPNAEFGLVAEDEVRRRYADVPAWVDRAAELAAGCRFSLAEIAYKYPEEGVPEGHTTASWVRHLTEQGALKRYGGQVPDAVRAQVEKELVLIEDLGYAGYFLTMYEIVEFCRDQGILCQGRGSAANSAVCYCLGITAVDPVRMNLLFERFLSKERAEPPDIDLDISHRRREEVIQHMYRRYGRHRAAMVANLVRYRSRSALREVGKVLDVPEVDLDRASKLLHHHEGGLAGALTDAGLDPNLEVHQRLVALAGQLRGFPRHLSIHPGGFVLGSGSLDRLVPVEAATMEDRTVIQWDKDDIETLGLFKVDLLGLGALTHLDLAFRLLKAHHGVDLTMATIPPGDEATFDMACRGDTVGVFQIESRAQMAMLPRLRPRTYYDLVIEVSLVRPGPITGGMVHPYLRRRQGLEAVDYPHPCLEPVLAKTLGIPLFQEQVMKLAMAAADYTPGEADQLRRDMAAWRQAGRIEAHRDRLVSRMKAKGIAEEFAVRVFDQIRGFGEYGFPESHAASFALIAYDTAWLKCHYPDVFACALLNAWPMGFYSPSTILGDAQRHGLEVRPVDLLASRWDHSLEGPPRPGPPGQAPRFALRLGLRSVRGLAKADAERLRISRPRGEKPDLGLWKLAAGVSVDVWEKLAVAGALEPWGLGRRGGLWQVLDQDPAPEPLAWDRPEGPAFEALTPAQLVAWDYSAAGLSPRAHLVAPLRPALRRAKLLAAVEVAAVLDGTRVQAAGLVICRQMPGNAKGVLFVTLEDETGLMNLIVWKNTWDRYRTLLLTLPFLAVAGKVQNEAGVVHLIADSFWNPEGLVDAASFPDQSRDFC